MEIQESGEAERRLELTDDVLACSAKIEQETPTKINEKVLDLNSYKSNRF